MSEDLWYRDREMWLLAVLGYLPWLAGFSLAWEAAHVSLYTIWNEADTAYIAFAVAHCTLGDVVIGAAALLVALILGRERGVTRWHWSRIAVLAALLAVGYTMLSEWMNINILRSWTYSDAMPTLELGGFRIGLTPLAQWFVLPPLALHLARKTRERSARCCQRLPGIPRRGAEKSHSSS